MKIWVPKPPQTRYLEYSGTQNGSWRHLGSAKRESGAHKGSSGHPNRSHRDCLETPLGSLGAAWEGSGLAWENLKDNKGSKHRFLDLETTTFEIMQDAIDSHGNIFVTADSTSMIVEIITRGYFVNVIELRGPIKREHHHEIIENFERKGLLRVLRLTELNRSKPKLDTGVRNFVMEERASLKKQIMELI